MPLGRPRSPAIIHDGKFIDIKRRCLELLGQDKIIDDLPNLGDRKSGVMDHPTFREL